MAVRITIGISVFRNLDIKTSANFKTRHFRQLKHDQNYARVNYLIRALEKFSGAHQKKFNMRS